MSNYLVIYKMNLKLNKKYLNQIKDPLIILAALMIPTIILIKKVYF